MRKDSVAHVGSRSRGRLLDAVCELLDERGAGQVTITDVVTAAGVTRPTFYAAFDDLPTAFAEAALSRLSGALEEATLATDLPVSEHARAMSDAFQMILSRLAEHGDFFVRVFRGPGGSFALEQIVAFLAGRLRTASPVTPALVSGRLPAQDSSAALAAGVVWLMSAWLQEEPRRPVPVMADRIRDFLLLSVSGGLGNVNVTEGVSE
jgi:AcrR family transcriptional regulator